ncbi:restriction endonuclease subunit S [Staphylococcus warneri]|uniref:restriction endonuclease subunit S n=1 Tax=Staphylococcus warneri TaxID=1292 RepID=UPI003BA0CBD5
MTNEHKRVPELRFPEFEDEWEEKKISDSIKILKSGLSRELSNTDIGLPVIRANNLQNYGLVLDDIKYWYKEDPKGSKTENYYLERNDILINFINSEAKMGTTCIIKDNFKRNTIYTTNILRYVTKENYDPFFHFTYTQTYNYKKWIKIITKPAVNQASFTTVDFKKIPYYIPKIKEQQKVGGFFSKLDRQIELEERKLELLEQQKKGYMQKIFSQELRFKDENGDDYPEWESKKIKELFNIIDGDRGKNYPSEKDFCDKGHTLFLDTGNVTKKGFSFYTNRFIDKEKDDMLRNGKLELNDFVITSRGTLGNIGFYDQNIHYKYPNIRINSAMLILRPLNIKFDNQYLYFLLKDDAIAMFMKQYRVGSAQPHITKKDFGNMKTNVITNINEQRKIAQFLTIIDKLVIKQCNKVRLLKQRKQGLLQKMFI